MFLPNDEEHRPYRVKRDVGLLLSKLDIFTMKIYDDLEARHGFLLWKDMRYANMV